MEDLFEMRRVMMEMMEEPEDEDWTITVAIDEQTSTAGFVARTLDELEEELGDAEGTWGEVVAGF